MTVQRFQVSNSVLIKQDFWETLDLYLMQKEHFRTINLALNEFLRFLGCTQFRTLKAIEKIKSATLKDVLAYNEWQKHQGGQASTLAFHPRKHLRSNATIAKRISLLNGVFEFLRQQNLIERNPFYNVKKPHAKSLQKRPHREIEDNESYKILDQCKDIQHRAILACLLGAGLRRSEISNLKFCDVLFTNGQMYFFLRDTKTNKDYNQSIQADMAQIVLEYYKKRGITAKPDDFLFMSDNKVGRKNFSDSGIYFIVKKYAEKAGVDNISPHSFRTTVATKLLYAGVPADKVMKVMRHNSVDATLFYDKRRHSGKDDPIHQLSYF